MPHPRLLKPSRRLIAVIAVQLGVIGLLGLLATGALGTGQDSPQPTSPAHAAPLPAAPANVSPPLANAPDLPNDPNRIIPEYEARPPAVVAATAADPAAQTSVGSLAPTAPLTSFDGLSRGGVGSGYYPPDPVGDVGLTQYVQAVNGGLSVFSKTGVNLTGPGGVTDTSFWAGFSPCSGSSISLFDPTVNYDQFADRWVYAEDAENVVNNVAQSPYLMCVAVSTTGDATDSWYRYAFYVNPPDPLSGTGHPMQYPIFPDYPKLAVWRDAYYLSFNDFDASSGSFVGAGAMALERSAMLAGTPAQSVFFDLRDAVGLLGGMLPADADGATEPPAGAPDYFVTPVDSSSNDQLGVWEFHVDWSNPANSTFTTPQALPVTAFNGWGISVPQPGTAAQLSAVADDRLMNRLQYRNFGGYETLVTNETVDDLQNGVEQNSPRWYELRRVGGAWSVNQQSTYAPSSTNRFMGSAAMNGAGDIALGYSAGDAATYPALRYTGRLASDPLSTMEAEQSLVTGGGSQTGAAGRWGDYSQLSVDPGDDCTFWYTGEYYPTTSSDSWYTRIGSFRLSSCTSSGPTYTSVPVVTGTTRQGSFLTTTDGTWAPSPTSVTYQWRRCDSSGITCTDIGGATSNGYLLTSADAGSRIRVKVTVTSAGGTSSVVSAVTSTILPLPPVNTSAPTISGTYQAGQTLSASTGTWTSALTPTYAYSWERCSPTCSAVGSGASYPIVAADVNATMRVLVTASTIGGSVSAYSANTPTVGLPPAPSNVVPPSISGTAQEGQTLTASTGSWAGVTPISYTYQWSRCDAAGANCSAVATQTGPTYGVTSADAGSTLRVSIAATNVGGGGQKNSPVTAVVLPLAPVNTGVPVLSGSSVVGSALVVTAGSWTSLSGYPIAYTYQWQHCGSTCLDIAGATSTRYDITAADIGMGLRAVVTATNSGGSTAAPSATVAVQLPGAPTNLSAPSVSGTASAGNVLTTDGGTWSGVGPISLVYQWQACVSTTCSSILGATTSSYTLQPSDGGQSFRVVVTATNYGGSTVATSSSTAVVPLVAPANLSSPTVSGSATIGAVLTADSGTWSVPATYVYRWQQCTGGLCADISGATTTSYTVVSADAGHSLRVLVTATWTGGSTTAVSASTSVVPTPASSGGGGGGGGGTPDLAVSAFATPAAPLPGDSVAFGVTVSDKNLAPATKLLLTVSLPTGITYVSSTVDRGSGCTSTSVAQVVCNLDYLSSDSPAAHVLIYGKVAASGVQSVMFSAASDRGDLNMSDNSVSVPLAAAATSTTGAPLGLNGTGTTTTTKTDKKAPTAAALKSTGKRNRTAQLRFKVYDDSGVAQVAAVVKRNGRRVGTAKSGFGPVAYGGVYFVGWHVPRAAAKGRYTFCVVAADRSKNHSKQSCAPLTLR